MAQASYPYTPKTSPSPGMTDPRPPKNAHNEAERRQSNIERSLVDFDNSIQAKVRKAQRVGGTLIDFNPDNPTIPKPPTTRA